MKTINGSTELQAGDVVRQWTSGRFGVVVETVYAGLSVDWEDRDGKLPTWHGYHAIELVHRDS